MVVQHHPHNKQHAHSARVYCVPVKSIQVLHWTYSSPGQTPVLPGRQQA